jgi:hypothetical protein
MSDDFNRAMSLTESADLLEFPSESDSPPATTAPQAPAPAAPPLHAVAEIPFTPTIAASPIEPVLPVLDTESVESRGDEASSGRHATVTEFPVQVTRPPSGTVLPAHVPAVTLVELLEKQGGLDWRQAVAVVHQICLQLKDQAPHAPILLEARNILINHRGEVRIIPGQTGGDPLVIQLGRLLRTMLKGNEAPPELRLLLAQATFELPIFESVEDVDRALRQLERLEEATSGGTGFERPVAVSLTPTVVEERPGRPRPRPILPAPHAQGRRRNTSGWPPFGHVIHAYGSRIAGACVVIAVTGGLLLTFPNLLWPDGSSVPRPSDAAFVPVEVPTSGVAEPPSTPPQRAEAPASRAGVRLPTPPAIPARASDSTRDTGSTQNDTRGAIIDYPRSPSNPRRATAPAVVVPSSRESERRAASFIEKGQLTEAAAAFNEFVSANPFYEPKSSEFSPEALAAFRASQRSTLPAVAQRDYERARTALAAGDADRALTLARDVNRILDRPAANAPPGLREQVRELIDRATLAKAEADDIVYAAGDPGIIPPRALSRQFPLTPPIGVPLNRVGTLEMVIDKIGGVERVQLRTPLNRYHERMVVSAAKAWQYAPATKDGKPVKCRITVKINLPESGTDY